MKIIHLVLGKANPDRMNGVNKLVFEMLSTQHALGYNVALWGITKNPDHDYPERSFETELFPMLSNKLKIHPDIKTAISRIDKEVIFHLHGSFIPEFYHIGKTLTRKNIPYVYTPHGALAKTALKRSAWKKKLYFLLFEKSLVKQAASIIATGKSVYLNIDSLCKVKRKVLIRNGQPLINRFEQTMEKSQVIFGFCGRLAIEHKGLDLLLKGFKIYKEKGGKGALHFIGDGKEIPVLKKMVSKFKLSDQIIFYGAQFGKYKFKLLSGFDVFVHPSRMEGFPAAVLEALSIGIPVMVSEHTNIWDYVAKYKCGLLVSPNTPQNIALKFDEFENLFQTRQLIEMGENGKKMIGHLFDWKSICVQLYDEYAFVLNSQNSKYKNQPTSYTIEFSQSK